MSNVIIGCSGFSYKHWKRVFYPEDLPERQWLEHYSRSFSSVELNVTFYHLPAASSFQAWYRSTPPRFVFAVKGSRYITHVKRLLDPVEALSRFFNGALLLREKLRVVLWQFPPAFKLNLDRFSAFLELLRPYPVRHTFEFRNETWLVPSVVDLCRVHKVSLCMADSPKFIDDLPATADFVYIRRHGQTGHYDGRYSKAQLARDAERIKSHLKEGREVFMYFNNDSHGYAPLNARELGDMLSPAELKKTA
jgi:uncharacterized protein YecE (DUF72 family)